MVIRNLCIAVVALLFIGSFGLAQQKKEKAPEKEAPEAVVPTPESMEMEKAEEQHFAIKELDNFHHVLHPLVHDAMPNEDFDLVRSKLDMVLKNAKAIEKAPLPTGFASKRKEFMKLAKALVDQVSELKKLSDNKEFTEKFDEMHETFEQLAGMLK